MEDQERISGLLGLARRAGKLELGSDAVETALRRRKIHAVIFAADASLATIEKIEKSSPGKDISVCRIFSKEELGRIMGRDTLAVIGITDQSFARAVVGIIQKT